MPNHRDVDWLLGRRYVADFRIVRVGGCRPGVPDDPEREVTLRMYGDTFKISWAELQCLIESGIVTEQGLPHESRGLVRAGGES